MIDNFSGNVHLQTKLREIVEKAVCVALCGFKLGAFLKRDTSSSKSVLQVPLFVFSLAKSDPFPKKNIVEKWTFFLSSETVFFYKHFIQNAIICLWTKQ